MKQLKSYLSIIIFVISFLSWFTASSQQLQRSVLKTCMPTGTVIMKDLATPPLYKNQAKKHRKHTPNEDEEEELPKPRKNKVLQTRPSFEPTFVSPIIASTYTNKVQPEINETPCVSYQGILQNNGTASSNNTIIPADVGGAAGFDHLFLTLNNRFRIQDKNGAILREEDQQNPTGFWASAGLDVSNLFDPKIIYDPYQNRWVYIIDAGGKDSPNSALYIAVSQTADPMGGWTFYSIDTDPENDNWADYPSVGFNKNWIVINVNMLKNTGTSATSVNRTFVINKPQLFSSETLTYYSFDAATTPFRYWTICPAKVYDPNYNDIWCATNDDANDNDIRFFKITGIPQVPIMTEEGFISVGSAWNTYGTNLGPQSGTNAKIDLGYDWIQSAVWRNGKLFTSQNLFTPELAPPTVSTIQLVSSDPVSETVIEAVRMNASSTSMYANPNFMVNNNEDWIISCGKFTNNTFPSATVLVRRNSAADFTETVFKPGEGFYTATGSDGRVRWGDYSTACIDPADDNSVWVAGDYALQRTTNPDQWATWWAKVCAGYCNATTYMNVNQPSGTMKKFEASNTVIANSIIDAGADIKLDAGLQIKLEPGFKASNGSRLRTYIEGCGGVQ